MFGSIFKYGLTGLFLLIDGIVYFFVAQLFSVYNALAKSQILQSEFIEKVANRFYIIIGVCMLFFVTYSLLKSLVNPDNMKDSSKLAINIVISLVLLSIVPSIFYYARELQTFIVEDNVIGQIVLKGNDVDFTKEGTNISLSILESFLTIPDDATGEKTAPWLLTPNPIVMAGQTVNLIFSVFNSPPTWGELTSEIEAGKYGNFLKIGYWAEEVVDAKDAHYIPIVSSICGAFLLYCLLSFCLDLGIRVVKLGFYQIIAPIPIMMRIVPNKKNVFDNWIKATLATYLEVFIRIFIMTLVVFIASSIFKGDMLSSDIVDVGFFGFIIIVLGMFAFAKQAPKLISNVIGIDSGNLKLGIAGKLDASGPLGKAINYIGKGTVGAISGGLGGMYGAAMMGASAKSGLLYGALNGWKGKKGQFNKQRQNIYSNVLDQKGTAGWFGGRAFFDAQKENNKESLKKTFLKSEETKVEKIETSTEFRQRQEELRRKAETENPKKYNELSQQLIEKMKEFENQKQSKIKELMEKMNQEQQVFEKEKQKKQRDLQMQLSDARDKKDMAKQTKLLSQLESLKNSTYSNPYLEKQISIETNKTSNKEIDDIRREMNKVSTVDENAIFRATQKEFMDANIGYKTSSKYVAQRAAEKAAKEWRENNPEQAAIQESIYKNAFESATKGGSPAGFGGSTGGASPSSSSGSSTLGESTDSKK